MVIFKTMNMISTLFVIFTYFLISKSFHNHLSNILKSNLNALAPFKKPRSQNVQGNIFVDESCIDCDVCRWICPSVFNRKGIKAAVFYQPINDVRQFKLNNNDD